MVVIWYAGLLLAELTSPGTRWNFSLLVSLLCFALLYITLYFRGGFSFVKTLNVFFGVCAIAVHLRSIFEIDQQSCFVFMWFYMFFSISSAIPMGEYYYSLMIYIRNQFMGCTLLMSCIQVKIPARKCEPPVNISSLQREGVIIQRLSDPRFPCIPPYLWAMGNHHYGVP